jgi:hypothetical protein
MKAGKLSKPTIHVHPLTPEVRLDLGGSSGVGRILIAVALEPIASGLFVIVSPTLFGKLVWSAELSEVGQVLGRLGGIVLLALGVACWPAPTLSNISRPAVRAALFYNLLSTIYLACIGVATNLVGVLLWPTAVMHAILGLLVARVWVTTNKAR